MKSVIIDRADLDIEVRDKRLMFANTSMPLSQLELLIVSSHTLLSSKTLLALSRANIALLCIDHRSTYFSLTLPLSSKNSHYKMAQFHATNDALEFAKWFISQKITLHANAFSAIDAALWLKRVENASEIESLLGIEGSFANLYFTHFFSTLPKHLHKAKRSKHPPLDPVNAMLSFVYTLVHNQLVAQLTIAGYEPSISYVHTPFRSHYALASDFLELFRADINTHVAHWFQSKLLVAEDFTLNNGVYLRYESRKKIWLDVQKLLHDTHSSMQEYLSAFRARLEPYTQKVA